jgi:hypothetical protein
MPAIVGRYPSVSPWNIRDLTVGDYFALVSVLKAEREAADGG